MWPPAEIFKYFWNFLCCCSLLLFLLPLVLLATLFHIPHSTDLLLYLISIIMLRRAPLPVEVAWSVWMTQEWRCWCGPHTTTTTALWLSSWIKEQTQRRRTKMATQPCTGICIELVIIALLCYVSGGGLVITGRGKWRVCRYLNCCMRHGQTWLIIPNLINFWASARAMF